MIDNTGDTKFKTIIDYVGEIKGKVYFKFHKVHFRANSTLLPTKSTLLPTKSALFVQ